TKLFNQVLPDAAFFGEKDFQQVAVIKKMVDDLCIPVDVVTVPTARAEDGLALSSRNGYLSDEERQLATGLYKTLQEVASALNAGEALESAVTSATKRLEERGFRPDYVEVRSSSDLKPAAAGVSEVVILAAAFLGNARLIDNLVVTLNRGIV
ncbi:MAG: pantoate--beta-alanine ligase, partial [Thalassolituus sp.]